MSNSPHDYGQPESPTEEVYDNSHYYENQQQRHQNNAGEDLGPPASPDDSPDYANEYPDASASPGQEGPQSPVGSAAGGPQSPEGPQSPDADEFNFLETEDPVDPEQRPRTSVEEYIPQSPVQNDPTSEPDEPKSPDNGPHDYSDEPEAPKSPEEEAHNAEDDSDNDNDNEKPAEVEQLMTNIFGEDSDDEDEHQHEGDDHEPRVVGYEEGEEEEEDGYHQGKQWDFDRIMEEKKRERSKKRKRRKDGSIDLCSNADDQIKHVVELMKNAAADDREANNQRRPAIQKTKMLEVVRNILLRADYLEALIDNDMMSAISEWLAPLPDKSLPALEIRSTLLKILSSFPHLEPGVLKQSGLGKAVMLIFKHPKETRENKIMASKLIRTWSQPIFQISADYASVTKEEREEFDLEHLPEVKRRKIDEQRSRGRDAGSSRLTQQKPEEPAKPEISRARVPKASTSAYIIRPKPNIDGNFQGATKNRQNTRFDRAQRDFKERTRGTKSERAIGVSIEGRRME
jgi:transcription factor SPN1